MGDISTNFETVYNKEVKHAYQQTKPVILNAVRSYTANGSTYEFPVLGTIDAVDRPSRNAEIPAGTPDHSKVVATLSDKYARLLIDDLDRFKTSPDYRRAYVTKTASAIARAQDTIIVDALDAATMETGHTVTAATGLTRDALLDAITLLSVQDVPAEDRFIIISPNQLKDALKSNELTNADFGIANAVQGLLAGQMHSAFGLNWIVSNRLTKTVNDRACYVVGKDALGVAMGKDIMTSSNYLPEKDAYQVMSKTSLGAAVVDTFGVVQIDCTEA